MVAFDPAFVTGAFVMERVMLLVALGHGAAAYAVRVSVTDPAVISAILGV